MLQPNAVDGSAVTRGKSCMQSIVCRCVLVSWFRKSTSKYAPGIFLPRLAWLYHFQPYKDDSERRWWYHDRLTATHVYGKHMQRI